MNTERLTGTCSWFDSRVGYGYIKSDIGNEYFVHQSELKREGFRNLAQGEELEFEVNRDDENKLPKAVKVTGPNGADVKGEDLRESDQNRKNGAYRSNYNRNNQSNYNDRNFERRPNNYERRDNNYLDHRRDRYGGVQQQRDRSQHSENLEERSSQQNENFERGFRGRGGYNNNRGRRRGGMNGFNQPSEPRDYENGWRK